VRAAAINSDIARRYAAADCADPDGQPGILSKSVEYDVLVLGAGLVVYSLLAML